MPSGKDYWCVPLLKPLPLPATLCHTFFFIPALQRRNLSTTKQLIDLVWLLSWEKSLSLSSSSSHDNARSSAMTLRFQIAHRPPGCIIVFLLCPRSNGNKAQTYCPVKCSQQITIDPHNSAYAKRFQLCFKSQKCKCNCSWKPRGGIILSF